MGIPVQAEPLPSTSQEIKTSKLLSEAYSEEDYLTPALEIVGFQILLNQLNRHIASDRGDYRTGPGSIKDNLSSKWEFDRDPFGVNQIGHPYQGSIYYGFARSQGLNFWESAGYTTLGSALWETTGETVSSSDFLNSK